jgi:hypothetical protein
MMPLVWPPPPFPSEGGRGPRRTLPAMVTNMNATSYIVIDLDCNLAFVQLLVAQVSVAVSRHSRAGIAEVKYDVQLLARSISIHVSTYSDLIVYSAPNNFTVMLKQILKTDSDLHAACHLGL